MHAIRTLAGATYREITHRPFYLVLLACFTAGVFFSKFLTLFSFYQEMQLVREMGMATIAVWGFVVVVMTSSLLVTQELEDRTAVTLLAKPIRRGDFLLGKFLGIALSLVPGTIILSGVLYLTLFLMAEPKLALDDRTVAEGIALGVTPFSTAWHAVWNGFVVPQSGVVLQGALLSFLQVVVLASMTVSFSAFFPAPVSVASAALLFILGNLSTYMVASVERWGLAPAAWAAHGAAWILPNLGYFNLQTHFSEGRMVSLQYLGGVLAYAVLYVSTVFLVTCTIFQRREVR